MPRTSSEAEPLLRSILKRTSTSSSSTTSITSAQLRPTKPISPSLRTTTHLISCLLSAFAAGWHDGCIGALIPFLKIYYPAISDSTLSLIFISSFVGYVFACFTNISLTRLFGVEGVLGVGAGLQGLGSLIIAASVLPLFKNLGGWEWSFGVVVLGFGIAGFGLAVQDAAYNTFVSRLDGKEGKLGVLHAVYGIGALVSPVFVLMYMNGAGREMPPAWFLSNAAWCLVVILILVLGIVVDRRLSGKSSGVEVLGEEQGCEDDEESGKGDGEGHIMGLKEVVKHRMVWTSLLFIALYTGSETTESSWIITFLLRERPDSPLSHYASTAFYTGLTSSRVLLLPLTTYLSPRIAIFAYIFLALLSQIVMMTVTNVKTDIVAIEVAGFVMGPVYPVTVGLLTGGIKKEFQTGALSGLGLMARAGSAGFPFLVGVLADKFGLRVLPGVMVGLFLGMGAAWELVPLRGKGKGVDGLRIDEEAEEDE